ncbi:MAG TPA: SpvB/TcaC N-terminal domain-containing protein, partial [Polyangiaceae bacterium]
MNGLKPWSASTSYAAGDLVEYNGSLYKALAPNTNSPPSSSPAMWKLFDPAQSAPGASGDLSQVTPTLNCVLHRPAPSSEFTAVFGYTNNGSTVIAPISSVAGPEMNAFNGGGGRGQPVTFLAGSHDAAFAVDSGGSPLTWTLGTKSITAKRGSTNECTVSQGPNGPTTTINGNTILVRLDPVAVLAANASATPTSNTAAVGVTPGSFQVASDGSATYGMPLWTPPARMGMGPSLSLSYSSNAGRGALGVGWSLTGYGLSRVTRCRKTIAQDGDASPILWGNDDAFCLDGQRLIALGPPDPSAQQQQYSPEHDSFTIVTFANNEFSVRFRDGRLLTYGSTSNSRHSGRPTAWGLDTGLVTYAWALDKASDTLGNSMSVSYQLFTDDPETLAPQTCTELLPQTIAYTAGPGQAALRSVNFLYEKPSSSEPSCRFVSGLGIGAQARLKTVTMRGPTVPNGASALTTGTLRTYNMAYEQSPATGRSRLKMVQECDPWNNCKPGTTFNYENGHAPGTFVELPNALSSLQTPPVVPGGYGYASPTVKQFVDLNADGKDDVIFWGDSHIPTPGFGTIPTAVGGYALSDGAKLGPPQMVSFDPTDKSVGTHLSGEESFFASLGSPFTTSSAPGLSGVAGFVALDNHGCTAVDPKQPKGLTVCGNGN